MSTCPTCRQPLQDSARFCAHCGTPLHADSRQPAPPEAGERRYLTVLFCDLIDSSSIAEDLGAEDFHDVVRIVHESSAAIVERFGGQVSQYLGDGILALFGFPHAHEDDAARAVHASLEVQAGLPACAERVRARLPAFAHRLRSRAAIHTGLVVIGELGAGAQRPVLALGEAVNTASRMQELAPPDSTLISGATRRLLGERFALESLGPASIRGIRTPLEIFKVTGAGPDARRHDAARRGERTPFVGRDGELAQLDDCWARVVDGAGQVVVLGGEPGIGKSRLLTAFRRRLAPSTPWFELRGSEYHQASELWSVLELLQARLLDGVTGADAQHRLVRALDDDSADGQDAARFLGSLLALTHTRDEPGLALLAGRQRQNVVNVLVRWMRRLSETTPIVLAVDDLQWIDPTSLELLQALVTASADCHLCVVATCRAPFTPPWSRQPHELRLEISPLSPAEARTLVESMTAGRTPPDAVMRDVLAKSDGVPLFLEEVTQMFLDAPAQMPSVPDSLHELLAARLDRLPAHTLETLQLGAVIGASFPRELLLAIAGRPAESVDQDLGVLLSARVLRGDHRAYTFRHVLLRDTAYERMLRSARTAVHGRVADTLLERFPQIADTQPEVVAHHLTVAGDTERAFLEWKRAGGRSLRNGAYREAAYHFQQALALRDRTPLPAGATAGDRAARIQEDLGLHRDLGVSLIATQGYSSPAVVSNYQQALRLSAGVPAGETEIPMHILYGLWGTFLVRGDREATRELAPHFERAAASDDPLARHVAHSTLGVRAFYAGEFAAAMAHCDAASALYDPSQHLRLLRDYGYEGGLYSRVYAASIHCFVGRPDQGLACVNEAVELAGAIGDPYARAVALGMAACIARERREPERAARLSDELLDLATRHEFIMWLGIGHCLRGWARLETGDVPGGTGEIQMGLGIWSATGARVPGTYLRLNLIDAALARADVDGGLALVEQGLDQCTTTLESYQAPEYHRLRGELLKLAGQTDAARQEMRRAVQAAREQGADWMELRGALSLARLDAGQPASDALAPLLHVIGRITEGADTGPVRDARALLAGRV